LSSSRQVVTYHGQTDIHWLRSSPASGAHRPSRVVKREYLGSFLVKGPASGQSAKERDTLSRTDFALCDGLGMPPRIKQERENEDLGISCPGL
jgi:hypothetical protein